MGQTIQSMRERHWGHRSEIRSGADGLGRHFFNHGENWNLKNEKIFEENVMQHFELTFIASVQPGQPLTQDNLDSLEGKFQKNLMCMDYGLWITMGGWIWGTKQKEGGTMGDSTMQTAVGSFCFFKYFSPVCNCIIYLIMFMVDFVWWRQLNVVESLREYKNLKVSFVSLFSSTNKQLNT